jgi:ABC-2 type transport system permease protein
VLKLQSQRVATRRISLREMWVIAKREFKERVHSKWFVVMTLLWPILMAGMLVVPALIGGQGTEGAKVVIVDQSGELSKQLAFNLGTLLKWETTEAPPDTDLKSLRDKIKSNELNGYVVIPKDAVDGGEIVYRGDNGSNQTVGILFTRAAQAAVIAKRGERAGLSGVDMMMLKREIKVAVKHSTGEEEGTSGVITFLIGYMIAFFIYIAITLYGVGVMRSVVSEKSSRIVELLVATTTPRAMMSGKILGVGIAGLTQIAIWFIAGAILTSQQDTILGWFGAKPDATSMIPSLSMMQIAVVLTFFVLGYLFYSAMYAAVGAMVSNEQDTQQAQMPVTFLLVIGIVSIMAVTNDPRSPTAAVLTNVPFWSPMLMPLRYFMGGASVAQVGVSLGVLAVSTIVVARAAAKIYRVGILMYGKRPSLRELVRWMRYRG